MCEHLTKTPKARIWFRATITATLVLVLIGIDMLPGITRANNRKRTEMTTLSIRKNLKRNYFIIKSSNVDEKKTTFNFPVYYMVLGVGIKRISSSQSVKSLYITVRLKSSGKNVTCTKTFLRLDDDRICDKSIPANTLILHTPEKTNFKFVIYGLPLMCNTTVTLKSKSKRNTSHFEYNDPVSNKTEVVHINSSRSITVAMPCPGYKYKLKVADVDCSSDVLTFDFRFWLPEGIAIIQPYRLEKLCNAPYIHVRVSVISLETKIMEGMNETLELVLRQGAKPIILKGFPSGNNNIFILPNVRFSGSDNVTVYNPGPIEYAPTTIKTYNTKYEMGNVYDKRLSFTVVHGETLTRQLYFLENREKYYVPVVVTTKTGSVGTDDGINIEIYFLKSSSNFTLDNLQDNFKVNATDMFHFYRQPQGPIKCFNLRSVTNTTTWVLDSISISIELEPGQTSLLRYQHNKMFENASLMGCREQKTGDNKWYVTFVNIKNCKINCISIKMVGSNKEEENYYFLSQYELVADDEDDDGRSDDDGGGDGSGRGGPGGGVRGGGVSVAVRSAVDDKKNRNTTFAIHVSDVGDFAGAKLILYERETSFKLSLRNAATNETYSFHYEICRGNVINFYKSTCKSKVDINVPLDCLTKGSCNTMNALLHAQAVGMLEIKGISVENMDLVTNFENIRLKLENQSRIVFCTSLQKFDQIMMFNTKITNYCEVEHINLTLFLPDKTIYRYRVRGRGRIPCNICQWTGVKEKVITAQSTQKVTRATHITQKGTTSSTRVSQHADTAIITRVSQPEDTITTTLVSQPEDTITTTLVSQPEDTTTTTLVSQPEDTVTSTLVPQPENTTISTQMGTEKTAAIKTDKPLTTEKDRVPTFNATETNVPVTVPTTEEILCLCPCNIKTKTKLENLTSEELHEKLAAELSIPRKETSKYVRSKLSMPDSRVSSNVIGSIITVAIVMPFASIILIDFVALVKWVFFTLKASR